MKKFKRHLVAVSLSLSLALLAACQSVSNMFEPASAVVEINVDGKTAKVPVQATRMFPNQHSVTGIKMIQMGKIEDAMRELEAALAANPKNWESRIALAALQESKGQLDAAKQNYTQSNLDKKSNEPDPNCLAGIKRIEARQKIGK